MDNQHPSNKITYIYFLRDPITEEVRYVGKSDNPLKRYNHHLSPSHLKAETHKNRWLRTLLSSNLKPILDIVEAIPNEAWEYREKYWIDLGYKFWGDKFTNTVEGGLGGIRNKAHTEPTKRKISLAHVGRKMCFKRKDIPYVGVYFHKLAKGCSFLSVLTFNGKRFHLGSFKTVEEAAKAYDKKALELFGPNANLNFPNESIRPVD